MIDPIEQYLREQSQEGRTDSVGAFTISAEKAMTKLAEYQLPRTSAWLLKMVQAGVAAGCESIAITQSGKSTKVCYQGGELGSVEELVKVLSDPYALVSPSQQHLLTGLRAVALTRQRPVLLVHDPVEGAPTRAFWNGSRISPPEQVGVLHRSILSRDKAQLTFHVGDSALTEQQRFQQEKGIKRVIAEEYRELMAHATVCPIPLTVDRRRLDHFGLDDASFHRSPLLFGAHPSEPGESGFAVSPAVRSHDPEGTLFSSAWTAYLTEKPRANEIGWVKDGVLCETETFRGGGPFYLRLYLSAQEIPTDLTGLHLRFESPADRRQRALRALEAFVESAPEITTSKTLPFRSSLGTGRSGSWWSSAVLTVGGLMLLPLGPGASVVGAFGLMGMAVSDHLGKRDYEELIKNQFSQWTRTLAADYGQT